MLSPSPPIAVFLILPLFYYSQLTDKIVKGERMPPITSKNVAEVLSTGQLPGDHGSGMGAAIALDNRLSVVLATSSSGFLPDLEVITRVLTTD